MAKTKEREPLDARIVKKLKARRPTSGKAGRYDVCLSTDGMFGSMDYFLTTGIEPFDTNTGGVPFGRITEIYGLESSGKTAMAIRCGVRAMQGHIYRRLYDNEIKKFTLEQLPQKHTPAVIDAETGEIKKKEKFERDYDVTIFYIDNEHSLDESSKVVVDGTELVCILDRCETVDLLLQQVDDTLQLVRAEKEETGREQFVVFLVDTIAGTNTKEDLQREWGKEDFDRKAKQLREGFRTMVQDISDLNVAFICTNQVSTLFKPEQSRGNSKIPSPIHTRYVAPAGLAIKFWATLRVFMYAMERPFKLYSKAKFPDGSAISFITTKNRVRKPYREGRMVLLFTEEDQFHQGDVGGLDNGYSILETLLFLKFAEYKDGEFIFYFRRHEITLKTFGPSGNPNDPDGENLDKPDDSDDNPRSARKRGLVRRRPYKEPRIKERYMWPEFYGAHREDFDQLWEKAQKKLFVRDHPGATFIVDEDDETESEE